MYAERSPLRAKVTAWQTCCRRFPPRPAPQDHLRTVAAAAHARHAPGQKASFTSTVEPTGAGAARPVRPNAPPVSPPLRKHPEPGYARYGKC